MNTSLAKLIARFVEDPKALSLFRELEEVRVQAKAVGLLAEFDLVWDYEQARFLELPCRAPEPKTILQFVIAVAPSEPTQ